MKYPDGKKENKMDFLEKMGLTKKENAFYREFEESIDELRATFKGNLR